MTIGMWLGASRKNTAKPLGISWPANSILARGINFSYNNEIVYNKNFEQKLTKMKSLLNLWYPRNLTLYGRITILKCLAISKLVYYTSVLTFPSKFTKSSNYTVILYGIRKPKLNTKQ